ncbi:MAG: thermonuclease family protein [Thermoguttaceae bacterium]
MKRKRTSKYFLAVFAVLFFVIAQTHALAADPNVQTPKGVCTTFIRNPEIISHNGQLPVTSFANLVQLEAEVVDGDTLIVTGKQGNQFKVRFVAAFAPEYNEKGGAAATDFVKKQIAAAGGKVVLFHDGDRTIDKYGRQLRLVCVVNHQNELVCLDELLIRNGLAKATRGDKLYYSSRPYFQQITPKKASDEPDFPNYDLKYLEMIEKKTKP